MNLEKVGTKKKKKQEQKQKTQTIGIFRGDGLQPIYLLKTQHIMPHLAENTFSLSVINTLSIKALSILDLNLQCPQHTFAFISKFLKYP